MADNETTADIIAEMRNDASEDEYTPDGILGQTLNSYADRLEAAHKRELSKNTSKNGADFGQLGDAAKLRNALKQVNELNDLWFDTFALPDGATSIHDEIENIISAALAATAEKSSAVDDCTKLREALVKIRSEAYECDQGGEYLGEGPDPGFERIIKMCDAALGATEKEGDNDAD